MYLEVMDFFMGPNVTLLFYSLVTNTIFFLHGSDFVYLSCSKFRFYLFKPCRTIKLFLSNWINFDLILRILNNCSQLFRHSFMIVVIFSEKDNIEIDLGRISSEKRNFIWKSSKHRAAAMVLNLSTAPSPGFNVPIVVECMPQTVMFKTIN